MVRIVIFHSPDDMRRHKASGSVGSRAYIVIQGTEVCLGHFPGQVDFG
jgi:hypothetical protein